MISKHVSIRSFKLWVNEHCQVERVFTLLELRVAYFCHATSTSISHLCFQLLTRVATNNYFQYWSINPSSSWIINYLLCGKILEKMQVIRSQRPRCPLQILCFIRPSVQTYLTYYHIVTKKTFEKLNRTSCSFNLTIKILYQKSIFVRHKRHFIACFTQRHSPSCVRGAHLSANVRPAAAAAAA